MITGMTVVYVENEESVRRVSEGVARLREETAGSEDHVVLAIVDPAVDLLKQQNMLLNRIADALDYLIPPDRREVMNITATTVNVHVPQDGPELVELSTKPKKAKKA